MLLAVTIVDAGAGSCAMIAPRGPVGPPQSGILRRSCRVVITAAATYRLGIDIPRRRRPLSYGRVIAVLMKANHLVPARQGKAFPRAQPFAGESLLPRGREEGQNRATSSGNPRHLGGEIDAQLCRRALGFPP